jgi:anti-sigma-K factor RskA
MITERHEELASLHALGLLEEREHSAFETELAGNRELADFTNSLDDTLAQLSLASPALMPPTVLKSRFLEACAASSRSSAPAPAEAPITTFPFLRFMPWAMAASLLVAASWLAFHNVNLQSEIDVLRTERRLAEVAYQDAQAQLKERTLLAESMINDLGRQLHEQQDLTHLKVTALASLAGNTPEAQAIAVWDPGRETGLLTVAKLPAIADNQDYQLWVVDPAYPNPVDGGVFKPGANGQVVLTFKGNKPIKSVAAFAISLEKKGGVPKAEGPIVLLGKVPSI